MKKLSAAQRKQKDVLSAKLDFAQQELQDAIDTFNEIKNSAFGKVDDALNAFNAALEAAEEFRAGITDDMQNFIDDRSENWHATDAASEYESWKSYWDDVSFDAVTLDTPEDLEMPDGTDANEKLDQLPDEVEA